jgi:hypothetical protein
MRNFRNGMISNNFGGNDVKAAFRNKEERSQRGFNSPVLGLISSNGEEVLEMHIINTGDAIKRVALFGGQFSAFADLNAAFGENVVGIIGQNTIADVTVDNATKLKNAFEFFKRNPVLAQQLDVTVDSAHLSQLSKNIRVRQFYPLRDLGSRDIVLQTKLRTTQSLLNKVVVQLDISFNDQTVLIMDIIGGADVTLVWTLDGSINLANELEKTWAQANGNSY